MVIYKNNFLVFITDLYAKDLYKKSTINRRDFIKSFNRNFSGRLGTQKY